MTYKQAYDKIIDAYFKDEIKPFDQKFCFCGTLAPDEHWHREHIKGCQYPYSRRQYGKMERALLLPLGCTMKGVGYCDGGIREKNPRFEGCLFAGMCAALEVLKQIHIGRGEEIDPLPTFTKRVFSDVLKMVKTTKED